MNFKVYGEHDQNTLKQMFRCMEVGSAAHGVLCADGHLGYAHPIGGVVAYKDHISLSGVGFDIGCGNKAVMLDVKKTEIEGDIEAIVSEISKTISFGVGRKNGEKVDHPLFDFDSLWQDAGVAHLKGLARDQLGTVGSGNHYVDLFSDEEDYVWIGVHFGSRGLGHKIATKYMELVGAKDDMHADPALIPLTSDVASAYIHGMELAGVYAYAGRNWVCERVRQIISADILEEVHNHHNFAWLEEHGGENYWVVRKGATPAFPGQRGFVGGSMGDDAVILEGIDTAEAKASLYSTVHGAGRVMSRSDARGRFKTLAVCTADGCSNTVPWMEYEGARKKAGVKEGGPFSLCAQHPDRAMRKNKVRYPGRVRHDEMNAWLEKKGVIRVGGDLDEAPQAYRRLPDVLAEHAGSVRIVHTLKPFAVFMAGNEFDPYKD